MFHPKNLKESTMRKIAAALLILAAGFPAAAGAVEKSGAFGIHASAGTDIHLGLGVGGGLSYAWFGTGNTALEFAVDGFYNHTTDSYANDYNSAWTDTETWDMGIFGGRVNGLFNYDPDKGSVFFIAGAGFVANGWSWKDEHKLSSGTVALLESNDGTATGGLVNLGVGFLSASGFEGRLETPLLYFFSDVGTVAFVPTFTLSLGYRFLK
jgi:hypothetical protein